MPLSRSRFARCAIITLWLSTYAMTACQGVGAVSTPSPQADQPLDMLVEDLQDLSTPTMETDQAPELDLGAPSIPDSEPDLAPVVDMAPPAPPAARDCVYRSGSFGQAMRELDVGAGDATRLRFNVNDLPDPASIEQATLAFKSFDADHPGQEGLIYVNDAPALELPAETSWDNMEGRSQVDVTGLLVGGQNRIEFGAGPLSRSFYRIGDVELKVRARVEQCMDAPPPPPPQAKTHELRYPQAQYTNRSTWVVGCESLPIRAYAFTARGEEHVSTDCQRLYRAGGDRRGEARFVFEQVAEATYRVVIGSRHTENRNPRGALILVNGQGKRISQRSDRDFTSDLWGLERLAGRVEVVLRAEGDSDSITFVRLEPTSP